MNSSKVNIQIPLDVPKESRDIYSKNYNLITKNSKNLFLFTVDHKIEHLNKDFYGTAIPLSVNDPERIFKIANSKEIGAFATQLGMIAKYGQDYKDINYIVKINSKTDLLRGDPFSPRLWTVEDIVDFRNNSGLKICGIGYTIYLGSEYEPVMLAEAAKAVYEAHKHGLIAILWMYPQGKSLKKVDDPNLVSGAAGIALCLGADFAKIKPVDTKNLKIAIEAAGKTGLICAGGKKINTADFLKNLFEQKNFAGVNGFAIGRNIYQRPINEIKALIKAIYNILYENKGLLAALKIYEIEKNKK